MSPALRQSLNASRDTDVLTHLQRCDADFMPPLSSRLDLHAYASKLVQRAQRAELWHGSLLVGLVAIYANGEPGTEAFVTSVSLEPAWRGQGWADRLLDAACEQARAAGLAGVSLEVHCDNASAIRLYERHHFVPGDRHAQNLLMRRPL
ncbi:GNAT family N-acetyltransferase [Roseateles sp. DB2]|uniref:GNAT family N-acetyltransferase n=1 Tax=Roseateles sp. DB2 TaxID=3453717 RepID=UPI003EF0700B